MENHPETNTKSKLPNIVQLERERMIWSLDTFPQATAISSLRKLEGEIKEVEEALDKEIFWLSERDALAEEYADCLMCLFDSAGRVGFDVEEIIKAFEIKLRKNKKRVWKKNSDNTYSHIKK